MLYGSPEKVSSSPGKVSVSHNRQPAKKTFPVDSGTGSPGRICENGCPFIPVTTIVDDLSPDSSVKKPFSPASRMIRQSSVSSTSISIPESKASCPDRSSSSSFPPVPVTDSCPSYASPCGISPGCKAKTCSVNSPVIIKTIKSSVNFRPGVTSLDLTGLNLNSSPSYSLVCAAPAKQELNE